MNIAGLVKKKEFDLVFSARQSVGTKYFVLYFIKNQDDTAKLGIITSRKSSKRAVCRNRIRRQIREVFRARADEIGTYSLIVIARSGMDHLSNPACRASLNTLLSRFYTRRAV